MQSLPGDRGPSSCDTTARSRPSRRSTSTSSARLQQAQINEASAVPKIDVLDWAVRAAQAQESRACASTSRSAASSGSSLGVGLVYFREHRRTFEARAAALPVAGLEHLGSLARRPGGRGGRSRRAMRPTPGRPTTTARCAPPSCTPPRRPPPRRWRSCSARAGEGRTRVASNLAVALARAGLSVLLVEADARRPAVAERFGKRAAPGLSELLHGRAELAALDLSSGVAGLEVLVGGAAWSGAGDRLASAEGVELLLGLAAGRDHVLVDTPPLLESADAAAVAAAADGVLFVAGARTSEVEVEEALDRLRRAGARVLAVAVNRAG